MQNSAIDRWREIVGLVTMIAVISWVSLAPKLEPWSGRPLATLATQRCVALEGTPQDKLPRCATVAMAGEAASSP